MPHSTTRSSRVARRSTVRIRVSGPICTDAPRRWIVGALGGRAAEEIVYGDMAKGAEHELEQVASIARQMVGGWYISGAGAGPEHDSPGDIDRVSLASTSVVDDIARRIVDECYAQAVATLRERRTQLDRLAHALLDRDTLDAREAYAAAGVRRPAPNAGSGTRGEGASSDVRMRAWRSCRAGTTEAAPSDIARNSSSTQASDGDLGAAVREGLLCTTDATSPAPGPRRTTCGADRGCS